MGRKATDADIQALTPAIAEDVYRKLIWEKKKISLMPEFIAPLMFDFCVNSGGALMVLDKKIDTTPEGNIDSDDIKNLWKIATMKPIVNRRKWYNSLVHDRLEYVMKLIVRDNTQGDFALGWARRVVSFFDFAYEGEGNDGERSHRQA